MKNDNALHKEGSRLLVKKRIDDMIKIYKMNPGNFTNGDEEYFVTIFIDKIKMMSCALDEYNEAREYREQFHPPTPKPKPTGIITLKSKLFAGIKFDKGIFDI